MIVKNNTKKHILLGLILIISLIFPSTLLIKAVAGPNIPEESPNNGWHWEVDVGDMIMFEMRATVYNSTSMEVISDLENIMMLQISSIVNQTLDFMGTHEFSNVTGDIMLHNDTDPSKLMYSGNSLQMAFFSYNGTDTVKERYYSQSFTPLVLPLNGTNQLQVDIMANILNDTMYTYMAENGQMNQFDIVTNNTTMHQIHFENSTDGYYIDCEYYPNNGTIKSSNFKVLFNFGGTDSVIMEATAQRVFDYDVTDEIEWGVNIGDRYDYDWFDGDAYDVYFEVTGFDEAVYTQNYWTIPDGSQPSTMVFSRVLADLYYWNGTDYEFDGGGFPLGIANNYYCYYVDPMSPESIFYHFLLPISTTVKDLEFVCSNFTFELYGFGEMNEIIISESTNSWNVNVDTGDPLDIFTLEYEKDTGFRNEILLTGPFFGDLFYITKRNMTYVEWDLEIGETIYYKENSDEGEADKKVIVEEIQSVLYNMTEFEVMSGGIFQVPYGQPELQFFKEVYGPLYEFDSEVGDWDKIGFGDYMIAGGNIYWAMSPLQFDSLPPLIITKGSTVEDLEINLFMIEENYDVITITPSHARLHNSTQNRGYDITVDLTTGRVTYLGGWMNFMGGGDDDWMYMSLYPKYQFNLSVGTQIHNVVNLEADVTISANIVANEGGSEYLTGITLYNPVNVSITNGTVLLYGDITLTNYSKIDSIILEVQLGSSLDLDLMELFFWGWNMTGTNQWDAPPPDAEGMIILDYENNLILLNLTFSGTEGPLGFIYAISYNSLSQPPAIPGYDALITIGISLIAMIGIIVLYKKKPKI